ncbi:hypothetical protein [Zooshikella sp. RANM57]|uniref:hypothetical protein n=1 Tax=Zooshikella sp. RANM57 TaxID=3425863 RepID=UPI003D6FBAE7
MEIDLTLHREVIPYLEYYFPRQLPTPSQSHVEIIWDAGPQRTIEFLKAKLKEQEENAFISNVQI